MANSIKVELLQSFEDREVEIELLNDFKSWMTAYRAGERNGEFLQQGRELAAQRRGTMLHFIQSDAEMARQNGISFSDYSSLPKSIQSLVEEPFTTIGDVLVTAICDHDDHTPQFHLNVYLEDNSRLRLGEENLSRTEISKLDVPIQGIQLDGWAAIEPSVFEPLEGADAEWALATLPQGNPDPDVDFFTGEVLGANPITAVAGGFTFQFSNDETLQGIEKVLSALDALPGKYTGSSVIFSEEVQSVQGKGFPIEMIQESQNQISINDTTGDKTAFFIRVTFSDKPDEPITKDDLENQINGPVSDAFDNYSYGKTSMTATASVNTYQVSLVSTEYAFTGGGDSIDESDLFDEAVALFQADGNPGDLYDSYDIVGVVFPKIDNVGWAGLGTVGGANSRHWLNGVAATETIVHEFGHNYGLGHSNYWVFNSSNAASTNPVDPTGSNEEYGDFWDVMGDGDAVRGHVHMAAKRYLSWLDANQIERVENAGDSGTYRLFRFDDKAATGLQGLEIAKSGNENYFLGFRRGFTSNANYYRGAYILWERPSSGGGDPSRNQGWIIDTTPESEGERQDAGIAIGRTYSDTASQVHITPIGIGGISPNEYLDVVVNYGSFSGNSSPQISAFNVPSIGAARTPLELSVAANDTDNDDLAYSWDLGNGEVYTSTSSVSVSFTVGGTYDVAVTISDMKGGTVTQSEQITISDPLNNWTQQASDVSNHLNGIADNGSIVVAVGDFSVTTSSDGQTWQNQNIGILNYIMNTVVWTGSEFLGAGLLIGDGGFVNGILASPDGVTWTPVYTGTGIQSAYQAIASNEDGSLVIAVGIDGVVTLRDSEGTWSELDFDYPANTFLGVAYGNGVFVIGGHDQVNNQLILTRTSDGVNFEDLVDNSDLPAFAWLDNMDFQNGLFLGSGFFSKVLFSENGGISWQTLLQIEYEITPFAFGNGVYYGIGENRDAGGALANIVSSDGKIWRPVDSPQSGNDIHFFNNRFIIVGDSGKIVQSGLVNAADEILAPPVISPASQEYSGSILVNLTTDSEGAQIRYTLDESEPDSGSTLFTTDILLESTTTIKAKVFKDDLDPSGTSSATFTRILSGFEIWIDTQDVGSETAASDNPDGDWANNLFEWAVGSLPNDGDSAPDPPGLSFNSLGRAVFTISRLSKSSDVTLSVEKSSDMKIWAPLPTTAATDSATMLVLVSDSAINTFPCFLRIKAED